MNELLLLLLCLSSGRASEWRGDAVSVSAYMRRTSTEPSEIKTTWCVAVFSYECTTFSRIFAFFFCCFNFFACVFPRFSCWRWRNYYAKRIERPFLTTRLLLNLIYSLSEIWVVKMMMTVAAMDRWTSMRSQLYSLMCALFSWPSPSQRIDLVSYGELHCNPSTQKYVQIVDWFVCHNKTMSMHRHHPIAYQYNFRLSWHRRGRRYCFEWKSICCVSVDMKNIISPIIPLCFRSDQNAAHTSYGFWLSFHFYVCDPHRCHLLPTTKRAERLILLVLWPRWVDGMIYILSDGMN